MNIDIVNKEISEKLSIHEKKVALVNKFYWRKIHDHFYSYSEKPINIDYICVYYPHRYYNKKLLSRLLYKLRRYKERLNDDNTVDKQHCNEVYNNYKSIFKKVWNIRKKLNFKV